MSAVPLLVPGSYTCLAGSSRLHIIKTNFTYFGPDSVSEWLRRKIRNLLVFHRAGSNPVAVEIFCPSCVALCFCCSNDGGRTKVRFDREEVFFLLLYSCAFSASANANANPLDSHHTVTQPHWKWKPFDFVTASCPLNYLSGWWTTKNFPCQGSCIKNKEVCCAKKCFPFPEERTPSCHQQIIENRMSQGASNQS